ncbi:MAG: hypothetical protein EAZ28_08830 [Oscillatoriales cyanobacterium]|nr:MAG: hypothetical protein EAZ28_08830 [Oscillatoriales cyanobacterium]
MLETTQTTQTVNLNELSTSARAGEQAAAALVFLLKNQPEEALPRLNQAAGWLDRSICAPPCPTHGK